MNKPKGLAERITEGLKRLSRRLSINDDLPVISGRHYSLHQLNGYDRAETLHGGNDRRLTYGMNGSRYAVHIRHAAGDGVQGYWTVVGIKHNGTPVEEMYLPQKTHR
jgi:hypothetical protein